MLKSVKTGAKHLLLKGISRLTGRTAQLLPPEAAAGEHILALRAPYRLDGPRLDVDLLEARPGDLSVEVLVYENHFPTRRLWSGEGFQYPGPCRLTFDLATGEVSLAGRVCGTVPPPLPTRRFCCRLTWTDRNGSRSSRLTGHYRPVSASDDGTAGVDQGYFEGENYFDHEAQSAGEAQQVLRWLRQFAAQGPVLEIGCATGNVLQAMETAGLPSYGLDFSAWAVERARERLGPGKAWVCNVETEPFPAEVEALAPFRTLVLWSVFEHFRDPFATLAKLGRLAAPGATLLLHTTNADSLTHRLFGPDWEGYFDWTHLGVEGLSRRSLQETLPRLGWRVEHLHTHLLWTVSADPTHATLREWYAADARFRHLLAERGLGDLVLVVARKTGPAGEAP